MASERSWFLDVHARSFCGSYDAKEHAPEALQRLWCSALRVWSTPLCSTYGFCIRNYTYGFGRIPHVLAPGHSGAQEIVLSFIIRPVSAHWTRYLTYRATPFLLTTSLRPAHVPLAQASSQLQLPGCMLTYLFAWMSILGLREHYPRKPLRLDELSVFSSPHSPLPFAKITSNTKLFFVAQPSGSYLILPATLCRLRVWKGRAWVALRLRHTHPGGLDILEKNLFMTNLLNQFMKCSSGKKIMKIMKKLRKNIPTIWNLWKIMKNLRNRKIPDFWDTQSGKMEKID